MHSSVVGADFAGWSLPVFTHHRRRELTSRPASARLRWLLLCAATPARFPLTAREMAMTRQAPAKAIKMLMTLKPLTSRPSRLLARKPPTTPPTMPSTMSPTSP